MPTEREAAVSPELAVAPVCQSPVPTVAATPEQPTALDVEEDDEDELDPAQGAASGACPRSPGF